LEGAALGDVDYLSSDSDEDVRNHAGTYRRQ
jgi:hypothetical protein